MKRKDKELEMFLERLKNKFGHRLKKIILFGSRARGDYDDESDYDFILIFDKVTPKIKESLNSLTSNMLIEYGMVITDFAFTEEDLKRKRYEPFIMNVIREGVVIYG